METEIRKEPLKNVCFIKILKKHKTYYLLLMGDGGEIPLHHKSGRIYLIQEDMLNIIKSFCKQPGSRVLVDTNPSFSVDEQMLYKTIKKENVDKNASVLNFINVFLDCQKTILKADKILRNELLFALADHLTFEKEFGIGFLTENKIKREDVLSEIQQLFNTVWRNKVVVGPSSSRKQYFECFFRFINLLETA